MITTYHIKGVESMKVSDGFWLNRNGYSVNWAAQIYEAEADERSVTVYAAAQFISNKGMTLGGPVLTVRFTSTLENSIKVTISHFTGSIPQKPVLPLNEDCDFVPTVKKFRGGWRLTSGKTSVVIGKKGKEWDIAYYYGDKLLTKSGWRTTSLIIEEEWHKRMTSQEQAGEQFFAQWDNGGRTFVREMLNISVGEYIYGFGEKFTPFVKNGQTVEVWNDDGGTCTEQSYKSVPFFVSSRSYGVFVNHTERVSFEVGTENVSKTAFSVQGESLEYFIFGGKNVADVIERYTALVVRTVALHIVHNGLRRKDCHFLYQRNEAP